MTSFDDGHMASTTLEFASRVEDDLARRPDPDLACPAPCDARDAPRMLIIEDAPVIALDLAETVRDLGFDVLATAFTREQALAEIARSVPEFAIIDLHLGMAEGGEQDGEALLSILNEHGCRCLVFSGDEEACRRVAELYPQFPVLAKPAQPLRLANEIERLRKSAGR